MLSFIARLIFILIVLSVVRSVASYVMKFFSPPRSVARSSPQGPPATPLFQDPVCGTYVAGDASLKRIYKGKVVHFCSPECRERYAG